VESDASLAWAHAELGEVLRLLGRYEEALIALDQALQLNPEQAFALGTRGTVLAELGRNEEALEALDRALELDPAYAFALSVKGQVLRLLGRNGEALACLTGAAKLEPHDPWTLAELGLVFVDQDEYACAVKALSAALELTEGEAWLQALTGGVLSEVGRFEEAAELLSRAIGLGMRDRQTLSSLGWALENLGPDRAREAKEAYEAVLQLEPDPDSGDSHLWARSGLANALLRLGETEAARTEYKRIIDYVDDSRPMVNAELLGLLGWCRYSLAEHEEAVSLLADALSLDSDLISFRFDLGLALMCAGRHDHALREYQWGLMQTREQPILRQRGLLRVALVDLDDAKEAIQVLPEPDRDRASAARAEAVELVQDAAKEAEQATPECDGLEWLRAPGEQEEGE
jgi:tetratricopeptide (TPR) repeat protein